jgi:hypothetical protein
MQTEADSMSKIETIRKMDEYNLVKMHPKSTNITIGLVCLMILVRLPGS